MKILPKNMKIAPIELTAPNLNTFLMINMKAFQADLQKFLELIAT
jgi:hypothetical protein